LLPSPHRRRPARHPDPDRFRHLRDQGVPRLAGEPASKPQQRPAFYIILTLATMAGVVMNFMHLDPIRALFLAAVINGVVAPPLLLLIVLLGRDPAVMKRYVSGTLSVALTAVATAFMAAAAIAMLA